MGKHTLTIEYTDDLLHRLNLSRSEFAAEAKFILAAKLYELGRLTAGEAAQLAGQERVEFLFALNKIGLPMSNLGSEDAVTDINFALHD